MKTVTLHIIYIIKRGLIIVLAMAGFITSMWQAVEEIISKRNILKRTPSIQRWNKEWDYYKLLLY